MLKDIPYSAIKKDVRAYEIMLLRDQYDNNFTDIAKEYEISTSRAVQIYNRHKVKQICLYLNHIALILGHKTNAEIRKVYEQADECYQNRTYACAHLEKEYQEILTAYRDGEPGMPTQFIRSMPPFRPELSEKMIARVIKMREIEKASFVTIAKELCMTQAKARQTYEHFYHKQVLELIKALQDKAETYAEKTAIWDYYFRRNISSKTRYDMLTKE